MGPLSDEEGWESSSPCLSPSCHKSAALWVGRQHLGLRCPVINLRIDSLPSLQMPALSTGCMDRGLVEVVYSFFYSGSLLLPGCLCCFFIAESLSIQCQSIGLGNQECEVSSLLLGFSDP